MPATPSESGARSRRRSHDPRPVRVRAGNVVDHALELLEAARTRKLLAGGHSLLPAMKLRAARRRSRRHRAASRRARLRSRCGRAPRDRRAHAARRPAARPAAAGALPDPSPHGGLDRRPAGPPPRHDRRLARARATRRPTCPPSRSPSAPTSSIRGARGERVVPAGEFFRGVWETAVGPGELLTEIRVPKLGQWSGWSYHKYTRRALDWAAVGVAVVLTTARTAR
jgi:carbon-monoxide dehydrogenase medium subunit